jgi:hypothetical protein
MTAFSIYLVVGALIGLMAVCANTKPLPAFVYAMTLMALIVLWPVCLVAGYSQRRGQRRGQRRR